MTYLRFLGILYTTDWEWSASPVPRAIAAAIPRGTSFAVMSLCLVVSCALPSAALDINEAEHAALKACERQFCQVVLGQTQSDFSCKLEKTWAKSKIKESVERKSLSWSVGDARCHSKLALSRLAIITAATSPKWTLEFPPHVVHCDVEKENAVSTVDVTLAPKILFRNGTAEKAWINVQKIDAPSGWKAVLWSVAKLEDTVGLFHRDILKEINRLMREKCPAEYGPKPTAGKDAKPPAVGAAK